jgi:hypothetical protein
MHHPNLEIGAGEVLALAGANGAGMLDRRRNCYGIAFAARLGLWHVTLLFYCLSKDRTYEFLPP